MNKEDCFLLGYISRISGVKGEVVVELDVDEPARYRAMDALFVEMNGLLTPFFVKHSRLNKEQLTLALEGVDEPGQAKMLVRCSVYLPLAALPELGEKHFYFHEIKGYEVIDERFGVVGTAEEVLDRLMQPVLRVLNGRQEILIPLPEGAIKKVNREEKKLYVTSPEGLIELYLSPPEE